MEINIGNLAHHLDYRKNYMFSHTATTIKKKTFIYRQNLEERVGDANISKYKWASVDFLWPLCQTCTQY